MNIKPINWAPECKAFGVKHTKGTAGNKAFFQVVFTIFVQTRLCDEYILTTNNGDSEECNIGSYKTIEEAKQAADEWVQNMVKSFLEE
jgi:hypothetical protein